MGERVERFRDPREWQHVLGLVERVFHVDRRLPELVSRLPVSDTPFFDGDIMFGPGGLPLLTSLAQLHGDTVLHYAVLDPGPDHWLDWSHAYGAFSFPIAAGQAAYTQVIYEGDRDRVTRDGKVWRAPTVMTDTETAAIVGDSGRWGVWAQRLLCGIAVSTDVEGLARCMAADGGFLSASDALDEFMGLNVAEGEFTRRLRATYDPPGRH